MKNLKCKSYFLAACSMLLVGSACKEDDLNAMLLPGGNVQPKVLATMPANGAQGLSGNEVWVLFDTAMDQQKTQSAFRLSSPNGTAQGSFRWDLTKLIFTPKDPLSPAGEYTMIAGRGSESVHGLDLAEDFIVRFFAGPDSGKPSFVSSNPADGATGVVNTTSIALTFSEPLDYSTLLSGIVISPSFINSITQSGSTVTITPASNLVNGTTYSITMKTGLKDASGNSLQEEKTISFTIGADTVRPTLVSAASGGITFTENLNTTGVERATALTITFSEAMDPVTAENSVTISPSVTMVKTWLSTSVLQVTASLASETNYTLTVDGTALDPAGNTLARTYTFPFYTDGANSVRPVVTQAWQQQSNAAGACTDGVAVVPGPIALSSYSTLSTSHLVDIQAGAGATCVIELRLDFNNNMNRTSLVLATSVIRVIDPSSGTVQVHDIQVAGNVVSLQLSRGAGTWPFSSGPGSTPIYKIKISSGTSGAKDTNGNTMTSDYELFVYF